MVQMERSHAARKRGCSSQRTCAVIQAQMPSRRGRGQREDQVVGFQPGHSRRAIRTSVATATAAATRKWLPTWESLTRIAEAGEQHFSFRPRGREPVELQGVTDGLVVGVTHDFDSL